jgi:2-amino-4-hydroxy-6-hydroxymethyldihydropteridine diphosphokinase
LRAFSRLSRVDDVSSLFRTAPVAPPGSDAEQPYYYNAACSIETGLDPRPLARFLQAIEREIGRRPAHASWAPRPIDIDILLYGDKVINDSDLVIPHARMHERAFVLAPLTEIAGGEIHPVLHTTIAEMARGVSTSGIETIAARGWDGIAGRSPGRVRI